MLEGAVHIEEHAVTTHDGWTLCLHRAVRRGAPLGRPVLLVPGYGMNGFIFRHHPTAASFMESLLARGMDPWSVDLRGASTCSCGPGTSRSVRLADQAFVDLPTVVGHIARLTGAPTVDAIGCSLGGAMLYAYASGLPSHRLGRLVTMGTPLRWPRNALTRAAGLLGPTVGRVPVRGTRRMARVALPVLSRVVPDALSVYLNPRITETRSAHKLVRTVEDPLPDINREMARWMRTGDLVLDGHNVTRELAGFTRPLLVVVGSGDRICPRSAALAALEHTGGPVETLEVAHPRGEPVGHADLFICDIAPTEIFPRVADWLLQPR